MCFMLYPWSLYEMRFYGPAQQQVDCNPPSSLDVSQLVPWLCDSPGSGVPAAVLQRGQLLGQEQRVRQQQVFYRPQVSIPWKYNCSASRGEILKTYRIV